MPESTTESNFDALAHNIYHSINPADWSIQSKLGDWMPQEPRAPKKYSQDWPAYDKAKTSEDGLFKNILDELLAALPEAPCLSTGRKPYSLRDRLFCICIRAYYKSDLRKAESILKESHKLGLIDKVPCYKSIDNFLNDPHLSDWLDRLILISALPLAQLEPVGAIDSTGFSTRQYHRWTNFKYGRSGGRARLWRKAHAWSGCKTNIILSVKVTTCNVSDISVVEDLLGRKTTLFSMEEMVADRAYSSRALMKFLDNLGLVPRIPFKKNVNGKSMGTRIWRRMFLDFQTNREEYMHKYHQRSNIEASFSMLKRRFGPHLLTKTFIANTNEIKAKVLCHNICVLIQELFESGIQIDFPACVKTVLTAQI